MAAVGAGPVGEVAALIGAAGVGGQLDIVDLEARLVVARLEADVVEHEEFGLGSDIDGVADAGRGDIGFGALRRGARVAGIALAGRGREDVAEEDEGRKGVLEGKRGGVSGGAGGRRKLKKK